MQKRMDSHFVDNNMEKDKNYREYKVKQRYLASTMLEKSFHQKYVFDIWFKLHKEQPYDRIQKHL